MTNKKSPNTGGNTFPNTVRLRHQYQFDTVYRGKHYAGDGVLVIRAIRNEVGHTRLGLSVSKKVGNAVVRNKWKRIIREAFRRQQKDIPRGLDIIVRPKKGAVADYHAVYTSLLNLCSRLDRKLSG